MTARPRTFHLQRYEDLTGVSGTGCVAWGVQWPDGTATTRWVGDYASTAVWPDVEALEAVHGHNGSTVVVWHDVDVSAATELVRARGAVTALCAQYMRERAVPTFLLRRAIDDRQVRT